jgi:hypothetical protein
MRYHKLALIPAIIAGTLRHVHPGFEKMKLSRQVNAGREKR